MSEKRFNIASVRHPHYTRDFLDWEQWRDTFEAGKYYRDTYLKKFSERETDTEFLQRRELTPISSFARSAILDVRNNIYQRLVGVSRIGGSLAYQNAVLGKAGGVDGSGSTMDTFIGKDALTELLLMGRVGIYVDAAPPEGPTLADTSYPPYLSTYRVEDILSWSYSPRGKGGEFQSVLLRDWNVTVENYVASGISLPNGSETRYRLVWKDAAGNVWFKIFDNEGNIIVRQDSIDDGDGAVLTNLNRVPFVMLDIQGSLMKDIASYQQALLNLSSSDVFYALKSNSPFLAIQRDPYAVGSHLDGPDTASGATGASEDIGSGKGRYYSLNESPPQFIAPPTETLEASMKLQERLEDSIRMLINLAIQSKAGSRTESAESKKVGQGGLEAGLSFIGLELEGGEKKIAALWAEYENVTNPRPATVKYPDRYVLKSDSERLEEAQSTLDLVDRLPTQELKRVASKLVVDTLLGGKLPTDELQKIYNKIDSNDYIMSDPTVTLEAHKAGLVDDKTASEALGYNADKVVDQAKEDRAARIAATLEAQTPRGETGDVNFAARGAPELSADLASADQEKDESLDQEDTSVN